MGCGAPLLPSVGLVDAMRVSPDTFHEGGEDGSAGLRGLMPLAARAWQQGRLWVNDPDCLVARPSYAQRERWADAAAASAGCGRSPTGSPSSTSGGSTTVRELLADGGTADRSPPTVVRGAVAQREAWRTAVSRRSCTAARIAPYVALLYPDDGTTSAPALVALADAYAGGCRRAVEAATQRTACLITYGDGIRRRGETPLHTLADFLRDHVGDVRQRRAPAADLPVDLRRRLRASSTTARSTRRSAPGPTSPTWPATTR